MMLSNLSINIATQPIPPSDIAILRFGNRTGYSLHNQCAHAPSDNCPNSVAPICKAGDPGAKGAIPELPTWSEITVSVSAQASIIGSQKSLSHRLGNPTLCGISGSVTDTKPRSAFLRISRTASSLSPKYVIPPGITRSGYFEYHSVKSQSFHARTASIPTSRFEALAKTVPQKPVICEGKLSIAQIPPKSMSLIRASMS